MSDIYKYLTFYLMTIPKLFDELPQILSSLDSGEVIMTSNIQDIGLRNAIDHILGFLPTIQTKDGWIREKTTSVIGHIFSKFLEDNVIKQPSSLSLRFFIISYHIISCYNLLLLLLFYYYFIIIIYYYYYLVKHKHQDRHHYI